MKGAAPRQLPDSLEGERVRLVADGAGRFQVIRRSDGIEAGEALLEVDDGTLFVRKLEIAPEYRSYGLGSESAHLLRNAAVAAGFETFRSWAAPDLGLSVYFWTRMGLHPLHGEGPNGGIWMERRLR